MEQQITAGGSPRVKSGSYRSSHSVNSRLIWCGHMLHCVSTPIQICGEETSHADSDLLTSN